MCRRALFTVTGCSSRLKKFRALINKKAVAPPIDLRSQNTSLKRNKAMSNDVDLYLTWFYWSVTETMPDIPDPELADVDVEDRGETEQVDGALAIYEASLTHTDTKTSKPGTLDVPLPITRKLPPGCWYETWLLYRAERRGTGKPFASFVTYWRTLNNSKWKKKLSFRGKLQFAKCNQCTKYYIRFAIPHQPIRESLDCLIAWSLDRLIARLRE